MDTAFVQYQLWVNRLIGRAETIIHTNRLLGYQSTSRRQYCEIG